MLLKPSVRIMHRSEFKVNKLFFYIPLTSFNRTTASNCYGLLLSLSLECLFFIIKLLHLTLQLTPLYLHCLCQLLHAISTNPAYAVIEGGYTKNDDYENIGFWFYAMTNNYFNYSFLASTCTGLPLYLTCMLTILELLLELCIPSNNEQCDQ